LELPSPARAKFQSSVFTLANAVFDPFGQIDTAIIGSKVELWIFGPFFVDFRRRSSLSLRFPVQSDFFHYGRGAVTSGWGSVDAADRGGRVGAGRRLTVWTPDSVRYGRGHRNQPATMLCRCSVLVKQNPV